MNTIYKDNGKGNRNNYFGFRVSRDCGKMLYRVNTIENIFPHSLQTTSSFFRGRLRLLKLDRVAVRITGPLMPILERCMGARPA